MNKKIKKRWIKALRSGKYKKCQGFLHTHTDGVNQFCVTGVLCDLYPGIKWMKEEGYPEFYIDGSAFRPDEEILVWADLSITNLNTLFNLNDKAKLTFKQLADWIEENL